ncbi:MAG TPA: 4-hydroxy-4-methyl-2-oxoglutarate aldolase [Rhodospirillales bacterium]|nr:4-hydroxy-4-methyl-2-oxoglutarate aldolase [Rhodospirillales bacterium]HIL74030.1 4-hydroxy-4-methyl-2-oxoglutarate aldolase [Rhodospirillales bacterium]
MSTKISDEILRAASEISAATMHEAAGKIGALPSYLKPISSGMKICGRAYPVKGPSGCNLWLHRAIAKAKRGDVLIADIGDDKEFGYWGDIMGTSSITKGIAGLVIDGCVRDQFELEEMGFPVFSSGLSIRGTEKKFDGKGSLEEPIILGNIAIEHGDLVLGDNDGIVIIPANQVEDSITKSIEREDKEDATKKRLRDGETTMAIYNWPEN